jgi:hypothetical protein
MMTERFKPEEGCFVATSLKIGRTDEGEIVLLLYDGEQKLRAMAVGDPKAMASLARDLHTWSVESVGIVGGVN